MAKSEDYIPKDLVSEIAKVIAAGIEKGAKKGFSAGNFMQDLQSQMDDFVKSEKALRISERVKNLVTEQGFDIREAELKIMSELAKKQNDILIKQKEKNIAQLESLAQTASINGNYSRAAELLQKKDKMEKDVTGLKKQGELIEKATKQREKQLKYQIDQEKKQKAELVAEQKIKEIEEKRAEALEQIGVNTKLINDFLSGGAARTLVLIGLAKKLGDAFSEAYKTAKAEGQSVEQAANTAFGTFGESLSTGFLVAQKDIQGARSAILETGGTLKNAAALGKEAAEMATLFGGSVGDAGKTLDNLSKLPGMTYDAAINSARFASSLAKAAGIPAAAVTKEVARNMEAVALAGTKNLLSLQKAVINSQKMGVEFSQIVSLANKLLDFENSINAQMEASVLLGREINLDRAREFALKGDFLGLQQELLKNLGTEADFNRMNLLQKQKLAEAMGVSVADLAKMIKGQGEQTELAKEMGTALESQPGIFTLMKNKIYENAGAVATLFTSVISLIPQIAIMNNVKSINTTLTNANTLSQRRNILSMQMSGTAAAASVGPMLAFGAAALMIGAGVGIAALGMAQFVGAFAALKPDQAMAAALAIMFFGGALIGFTIALSTLTATGVGPLAVALLLSFGAAFTLIGFGVKMAADSVSELVPKLLEMTSQTNITNLTKMVTQLEKMADALSRVGFNGALAVSQLAALGAVSMVFNASQEEGKEKESMIQKITGGKTISNVVDEIVSLKATIKALKVIVDTDKGTASVSFS